MGDRFAELFGTRRGVLRPAAVRSSAMSSTALPFVPSGVPPAGVPDPSLFHLDGSPVRAAVCDAALFQPTRPAAGGPTKAPVYDQMDARLWQLPGVYCLLWDPANTNPTRIYIGSSGALFSRIVGHPQTGWSHAALLTGHGVGRAGAEQAESGIAKVLRSASPSARLTPVWQAMPSPWGADMPWYLFESLVVLLNRCMGHLGVTVYLDPTVARL
jgi:hypothetical protein